MKIEKEFEQGKLYISEKEILISKIPWAAHAKCSGVYLKHLITAKDTCSSYSYHLVKIAPKHKIEKHIHPNQIETHEVIFGQGECVLPNKTIRYKSGTIAVLPAGLEHEVIANDQCLFILAKFFPALC